MASVANEPLTVPGARFPWLRRLSPVLALAIVILLLPLALISTINQPIGAMLWDLYIYLDAANRIASGQVPSVDFFAPVGALGYYLFAAAAWLFPAGQPLFLSAWSLFFVSAPLMAIVLADVQRRSILLAFALLLPFLLYSLLPFNTGNFYPYPGSEGFGIYNRQVCQLLYILVAALVFVEDRYRLCASIVLGMLALFFVKVTGVVTGALMCIMALAAGRLSLRISIIAGLIFLGVLGVMEFATGIVSAYIGNILSLLQVNEHSLLPRLLKAASMNIGAALATAALCLALLLTNRGLVRERLATAVAHPSARTLAPVFDLPFVWLSAFLLAGLFFESQNTGSQSLVFLWPLLLHAALGQYRRHGKTAPSAVVAALVLVVAAPPALAVIEKASRAWVGMIDTIALDHRNLKTLGAFSTRPSFIDRARRMEAAYVAEPNVFATLAAQGEPASFLVFSDFDFQWSWLQNAARAISAVKALEAERAVRFETVMSIDFVNPFPWLMDRKAPLHLAIGADPTRAVPALGAQENAALGAVDLALLPTCPTTPTQASLLQLYGPALAATHTRMALTPCYDAFIRDGLGASR
jgi:hypothetical protein